MKKNSLLAFIVICLLFSTVSCISVKAPEIVGFVSKYKKTDKKYPGLLIKTNPGEAVCNLTTAETPKVYIINGLQLKDCLKDYKKAIVYIWDPHCASEQCISPTLLQQYCNEQDTELFVVAEYYDGKEMAQFYDINHPIFGIDTEYYKTNFTDRYTRLFSEDLAIKAAKDSYSRMHYFENGEYKGFGEFSTQSTR
ncbi:hypothetical protein [Flavobacterium sp.]|uniref:hypothetical protein n=1 Tax=Flavobacterium sp. TaxID=239 RepID=UPI0026272DA8|nr:hypothetical protein [Flavobacterium sp.]